MLFLAWSPVVAETPCSPGNATQHRRALLAHEFLHAGSFCLGGHLAPLTFLLGCQRCGTNSLYEDIIGSVRGARPGHALRGEPEYYSREQHFFATDTWSQGAPHYLNHFPDCPGHSAGFQFVLDATPAYLRKPIVADRMHELMPNAALPKLKFVVILRDPAMRLYAYWDTFVLKGAGVNNFDTWLDRTLKSVRECQRKHGEKLWPPPDTSACDEDTIEGVAAGLYAPQLAYWFKKFEPKQFLLTSTAAYKEDTQTVVKATSAFVTGSGTLTKPARQPDSIDSISVEERMSKEARAELGHFYRPHNADLLHLLNNQPKVTYTPSLKQLGIQQWLG
mmetsp:Transcript_1285/g.2540  ORF Transcript_1285/g.2540 Transcript_1285/m.2540 type:complete len:334 (+) Transcript_1285:80-1081(+)